MQEKEVFFTDNLYPKAQSVEIKRLLHAIDLLIKEGRIKSFKSLAEKAGYSSQDFTDIKTGRKSLQLDFLDKISNISSINKSWVLTGEGEMMKIEQSENKITKEKDIIPETFNRFFEALERRDRQIDKRDEQIDRLITLLEGSFNRDKKSKGA